MSEWKKVKLKDITISITDGKHGDCKDQDGSGYYFVSCKDVYDGDIHYENARQITKEDFEDTDRRTKLAPNDILITNSGTIGRMAFVKDQIYTRKTTFQKSVAIVKPDSSKVFPLYLYYLLQNIVGEFINSANGAAQKNLLLSTMRDFDLDVLNSIPCQIRIATILSRYDTLLENYQKQIKLLEEAAQRLYKEWFVDLRFPGHENTKMVDGLPEGWERKRLVDFAKVTMGQSPKSEFYNNERNGLPFHQGVGSYGNRFVVDETYSTSYTRIAEPNSVLFSVRAPVGRLNITKNKIVIGRGLAAMNHVDGCQSFLFYLLKERFFKDNIIGNGAIFASISKDELLNLEFMIPTDELTYKFNDIAGNIDDAIMKADNQIRLLTEARDRLLPRLMGGEIIIN